MSLEIFRNIEGYDGRYQITSWGRVYDSITGNFLKQEVHWKGYLRVDLYDADGNRKHHRVHRLVAQAFLENPNHYPQVNHIDGNNQNNSITNLEWVTDRENKEKAKELRKEHLPNPKPIGWMEQWRQPDAQAN